MKTLMALLLIGLIVAGLVYAYRPNRTERRIAAAAAALAAAVWLYLKFLAPD